MPWFSQKKKNKNAMELRFCPSHFDYPKSLIGFNLSIYHFHFFVFSILSSLWNLVCNEGICKGKFLMSPKRWPVPKKIYFSIYSFILLIILLSLLNIFATQKSRIISNIKVKYFYLFYVTLFLLSVDWNEKL